MSEDLIKVVIDYNLCENKEANNNNISTGNFVFTPFTKFDKNNIPNPDLVLE